MAPTGQPVAGAFKARGDRMLGTEISPDISRKVPAGTGKNRVYGVLCSVP